MMRISLSIKVFVMFSSLTLMTLILSYTSYTGNHKSLENSDRIVQLKDFIFHIEILKNMIRLSSSQKPKAMDSAFAHEIEQVRGAEAQFLSTLTGIPPGLKRRIDEIPGMLDRFEQAFKEFADRYAVHTSLPERNRQVFIELKQHLSENAQVVDPSFHSAVNDLWLMNMEIYHHHDISLFPELKALYERMKTLTRDEVLLGAVARLIRNLEANYINYLAIKNREAFLEKTALRFFDLANEAISMVSERDRRMRDRHTYIILWVSLWAIALNLVLWGISSRYIRRVVRNQKAALRAVETDDHRYEFPPASRDEIGDLAVAMKHMARRLSLNRERYQRIINQGADGVYIVGMDGRIIDVNNQACRDLGYPRTELISMSMYDLDIDAQAGQHKEAVWAAMGPEETVLFNGRHQRKDGSLFPVEVRAGLFETREYDNIEGKVEIPEGRLIIAFVRDISQRQRTEKALAESEAQYRSMMESMNDPVYICSSDHRVEYMNTAMIRRTGRDATGERCFRALHDRDEKCDWCRYDKIYSHSHFTTDITSPRDDRDYLVSSSPIVRPDGSISKLTIYRDVTELKQLEAQLRQAQKMESIGTLAGGIAHDFNNILFPIMGYTEMMLAEVGEDSTLRPELEEVLAAATRAKALIRQILTFSRQDGSELTLMKIQPILKEALKLIRSSIPTTIEIRKNIDAECPAVKADPTQIHQIIMNLCTNAFHAMEEAGGVLTVTLTFVRFEKGDIIPPDMKPGGYNCLAINDTGVGMDEKLAKKIFDPYFTTKEENKGTGLGLSVIHGIVSAMGGGISLDSRPGQGSCFKVYFPVVRKNPGQRKKRAALALQGGSESILLVDDEPAIAQMMKKMLGHLGYAVTAGTDSRETLSLFQADPQGWELVITDLAMPKLPGDKLAREMLKARADIPIILYTGFGERLTDKEVEDIGISGVLMKPVRINEMALMIRRLLDSRIRTAVGQ